MPEQSKLEKAAAAAKEESKKKLLARAAAAQKRNALRKRDGEWTLVINLALVPASESGVPGTDDEGNDPRTDDEGNDPRAKGKTINVSTISSSSVVVHPPIEIHGASIAVRFAAHAAEKIKRQHSASTATKGSAAQTKGTEAATEGKK